jgi:hypothetical protein
MTFQEYQAALNVLLEEIASIKVALKGLDYAMHIAINRYPHKYLESWAPLYATLRCKEEDVADLEDRYYAQFVLVPSQYDTVGFPSGITNIYGQDKY